MKLRSTDRRFDLYRYGFDCYLEFNSSDWNNYNRYTRYCRDNFGNEFWQFAGRVYDNGVWRGIAHHQGKGWSSKRIYFRGEEYYTMLLLTMPADDKNTVYL